MTKKRFVEIPGKRLKRLTGRRGGDCRPYKDGDVVPWGPEQGSRRVYHRHYRARIKRQLRMAVDFDSAVLADIREESAYRWYMVYMS